MKCILYLIVLKLVLSSLSDIVNNWYLNEFQVTGETQCKLIMWTVDMSDFTICFACLVCYYILKHIKIYYNNFFQILKRVLWFMLAIISGIQYKDIEIIWSKLNQSENFQTSIFLQNNKLNWLYYCGPYLTHI